MTKEYGNCGPYAIGAITGILWQTVLIDWSLAGLGHYKGYAPLREIRDMLEFYGIKHKFASARGSRVFALPEGYDQAIARIQWLPQGDDPDRFWDSWQEAQQHTHYVAVKRTPDGLLTNDTLEGVIRAEKYPLDDGIITSYLLIEKQ